jgi:hypothetical protein
VQLFQTTTPHGQADVTVFLFTLMEHMHVHGIAGQELHLFSAITTDPKLKYCHLPLSGDIQIYHANYKE